MEDVLFSRTNKNVQGHTCTLPSDEEMIVRYISSGLFVGSRRAIRKMFIVSPLNPRTKALLKSTCEIRLEEEKHLQRHYFMIHPFSAFRMHWEALMILAYSMLLCLIPIEMSFASYTHQNFMYFKLVFDSITYIDIILFFCTGYVNHKDQTIVMGQRHVTKHYLKRFFIIDVLSSFPIHLILYLTQTEFKMLHHAIKAINALKLFRIPTLLRYMRNFCERMNIMSFHLKIFDVGLRFMLMILWGTCVFYILASDDPTLPNFGFYQMILRQCDRVIMKLLLIGTIKESAFDDYDRLIQPILIICGSLLHVVLLAQVMQIYNRNSTSKTKYNNLVQQIGEYMEYKELPIPIQHRVFHYVDFKFQKNIYKESDILNSLSSILKEDILLHKCKKLVSKVDYFKSLPTALILRIATKLKSEIYLPNDVIVQAGIAGHAMYFILIGTVAVYTRTGKEICHLYDGSHFGEISLVINEPRVASCVAVKECELMRLSRKDYQEAIQPFPQFSDKIRASALSRLETTRKIMDDDRDDND